MIRRRPWTANEEDLLIHLVERKKNIKEISRKLNRSERAIEHRLTKLRKSKDVPYFKKYAEEEIDLLTSFSNDPEEDTTKEIADYLGKTRHSVNGKLYRLRKESNHTNQIQRRWSKREDAALINSKGKLTYGELAKELNRSKSAVTHRAIFLGITKKKLDFSEVGKDIRRLAAEGYTRHEIAEELSLEYTQIRNYIYRNKIDCKSSSSKKTEKQKRNHWNFMKHATRRY